MPPDTLPREYHQVRGFAFCNDLYDPLPAGEVATRLASHGYAGIELDARCLNAIDVGWFADHCAHLGIQVAGLHWLLSGPADLHLTHPSAEVRGATLRHLRQLTRSCAAMGGTVMVLGGGKKRGVLPGVTHAQAIGYAREALTALGEDLVANGVLLGIEPLEPSSCNLINTAEAAAELADMVGCPNIGITLDARAMEAETMPRHELVRSYARYLVHLHANDVNRSGPGMGDTDIAPMLMAANEIGYSGWMSVEAFDPSPDPDTVARVSLAYLNSHWTGTFPVPQHPTSNTQDPSKP